MVGRVGVEPTTTRLKVGCSTTELPAHARRGQPGETRAEPRGMVPASQARVPNGVIRCYRLQGARGVPMLTRLTRHAHWLDLWLRKHLGRPYETILAIGLVLSIGASVTNLSQIIGAGGVAMKGDIAQIAGIV